jgi:NAD(P)-dependent dehydrogenase (short-subunit alcohol dehydrogenase family)
VSNASLIVFGRFEEVPPEADRHVIETNLLGTMHRPRAALPHFRQGWLLLRKEKASRR